MALVNVTGTVWDHSRTTIPANLQPRLWFVPDRASVDVGLMPQVEVQASLNAVTGEFSVWLENAGGMSYQPRMDWLIPGMESEPPGLRARTYEEWPFRVFPGLGGPISELVPADLSVWNVLVQLDDPPAGFKGWWLHAAAGDPDDVTQSGTGELRKVF